MTNEKLLPCPFYGSEANWDSDKDGGYCVLCTGECFCGNVFTENGKGFYIFNSKEAAIKAWNTHADPSAELFEALAEILEDAEHILYNTPHLGSDYFEKAHAAIAKAQGLT